MRRSTFWLLLATGFILRIFAWWLLPSPLTDDAGHYQQIALNLLEEGRFFGSEGLAFRPPLQPFFIFLIYGVFGENLLAVVLMQIFVSLLTAVLIRRIVSFVADEKTGKMAFVLALFSFDLSLFASLLMSETIFIFLIALGFWALVSFHKQSKRIFFLIAAGLSWGLSVLARPVIFPVLVFLSVYFGRRKVLGRGKRQLVFWLLMLIPVLVWSIRNTIIFQQPAFISTNGGLNFYIGNNPYSQGSYDKNTEQVLFIFSDQSEMEKNRLYFQKGIEFISTHPQKTLVNIFRKSFYLLATFGGSAEGLIIREFEQGSFGLKNISRVFFGIGQLISYWLILVAAIYFVVSPLGGMKKQGKRKNLWLKSFLIFAVGYVVLLLPFFTFPRFRIPLLLPLIIFGSLGIQKVLVKVNLERLRWTFLIFGLLTIRDWLKLIKFLGRIV